MNYHTLKNLSINILCIYRVILQMEKLYLLIFGITDTSGLELHSGELSR